MKNAALTAIAIAVLGLSGCKKDTAKDKDPTTAPDPVAKDKKDPNAKDPGTTPTPTPTPTPVEPAPPPAAPAFVSTEGKYSIDFGGTPTEQVQTQDTAVGKLDIHLAAMDLGNAALLVSWQEQPPKAPKDPKVILDGQREGMMSSFPGSKISDQKEITLGTNPGRSFTLRMLSPDATQFTRVYVVGNRMYQLAAIGAGDGDAAAATKFLDSFKLIDTK